MDGGPMHEPVAGSVNSRMLRPHRHPVPLRVGTTRKAMVRHRDPVQRREGVALGAALDVVAICRARASVTRCSTRLDTSTLSDTATIRGAVTASAMDMPKSMTFDMPCATAGTM